MQIEWELHSLTRVPELNGSIVHIMDGGHTTERMAVFFVNQKHDAILVKPCNLRSRADPSITPQMLQEAVQHLRRSDDGRLRDVAARFDSGDYANAASSAAKFTLDLSSKVWRDA